MKSARFLATMLVGCCLAGPARAEPLTPVGGVVFRPSPDQDLAQLSTLVAQRLPALQQASLEVDLASAEVRQSRLLENPTADFAVGTIPVGQTNPRDLASPYANVPNYGVGLSYRFLIGKRGPRQERATALEGAAQATRETLIRRATVELVGRLGDLALATLRADGARAMLDDAKRSVELARARLASSFGTPLDVDRLEIEAQRVDQVVLRNEAAASEALSSCSSILGSPCVGFTDRNQARAFLIRWVDRAEAITQIAVEQRSDIRALDELRRAASAEQRLARAMAVPDPTVRVGYLHDRFVVSGNQQNSLNVAVAVPLPIFDRGQAMQQAAVSKAARLSSQRQLQIDAARARIPALRRTLEIQRSRGRAIETQMLPRARGVLRDLETAATNRLVPLHDVIQARRTVNDLMMDESDSLEAAFGAALELMLQLPGAQDSVGPREAAK
ncbi:MAG TPA: TolC family protein [Polyangiaceae bacterium]|nr:TolC family protein [Polyangiaceae bacterium]